jgi:hypothetical protein
LGTAWQSDLGTPAVGGMAPKQLQQVVLVQTRSQPRRSDQTVRTRGARVRSDARMVRVRAHRCAVKWPVSLRGVSAERVLLEKNSEAKTPEFKSTRSAFGFRVSRSPASRLLSAWGYADFDSLAHPRFCSVSSTSKLRKTAAWSEPHRISRNRTLPCIRRSVYSPRCGCSTRHVMRWPSRASAHSMCGSVEVLAGVFMVCPRSTGSARSRTASSVPSSGGAAIKR